MTTDTDASPQRSDGVNISGALIAVGIATIVATVALGVAISNRAIPDKLLYVGLAATATLWIGVLIVCLRDSMVRRIRETERTAEEQRAEIELRLAQLVKEVRDSGRRTNAALLVLHDEVNSFAEEHTGEIKNLTEAIRAYGEERETEGELGALREATAGGGQDAPVDRPRLRPVL